MTYRNDVSSDIALPALLFAVLCDAPIAKWDEPVA